MITEYGCIQPNIDSKNSGKINLQILFQYCILVEPYGFAMWRDMKALGIVDELGLIVFIKYLEIAKSFLAYTTTAELKEKDTNNERILSGLMAQFYYLYSDHFVQFFKQSCGFDPDNKMVLRLVEVFNTVYSLIGYE